MALSLIAYFCTMVSALAVLMAVLSSFISPHHLRRPHPIAPVEQGAALSGKAAVPIPTSIHVAADASTPEKRLKARSQKPSGSDQTQRPTRYRNRLPQQPNGSGHFTALAFQQEIFWGNRPSQEQSTRRAHGF
jgi:hypothetical protein